VSETKTRLTNQWTQGAATRFIKFRVEYAALGERRRWKTLTNRKKLGINEIGNFMRYANIIIIGAKRDFT